ncbi:dynein regulatory complex subunit 4-like [Symphorus nematophorus]
MLTVVQPPKKKGSSKKPAKPRTPTLIDGLTKEEMSKDQLEEHIVRLREELDREREERNYFQLERDKIHTFWEITDRQLEEVKAERKNLDKDIEEDEGRHQVEIKVYKQKMKHLLCEHQNTISELKADDLVSTKVLQEEQEKLENELHKEMRAIMVDMQELDNETLVKELELEHDEEMTKTRNSWEKQLTEIKAKYQKKMEVLAQDLDNINKKQLSGREEHWNSRIANVTDDNNEPPNEVTVCLTGMEQDLKRNSSLQDANENIKKKELDDLKCYNEALEQKFSKLQMERDELYNTFTQNIQKVQHKAGVQSVMLERRLQALTDGVEKTKAQLCSVLTASNIDQTALAGVTNKIEARKDLLLTYEAKQRALGVPLGVPSFE